MLKTTDLMIPAVQQRLKSQTVDPVAIPSLSVVS